MSEAKLGWHNAIVMSAKQGKRIADAGGKIVESSPEDYNPAVGCCEARRAIDYRAIDRDADPSPADWYGI